ncbi:nucleotidyltransferase domain-containing protein [Vibrio variabilis]|uniref:nucleotidyltransferase domain-containing protein n=1 Tax=Vibrio variabilis TaxID=990271 RepID=UPI001EFA2098|nr:nucleotidyltransferase domain-containing protein [Vibrio variabilis]
MIQLDNGLDEHGYIRNVYSPLNIQDEFKIVVDAAVNELTTKFPDQIDGIYLYGSIGRGNAVLCKSDLDLSVVLKHPQNNVQRQVFRGMADDFPRRYTQVSKIDLDIGHVDEVLQADEYYRWQFWLKHCCCCIWGNDLSKGFESQKPSYNIAMALNGDLFKFTEQMIPKLLSGKEQGIEKVIGKKLLRTATILSLNMTLVGT